ncbi:helix-turn-helix transcriptional regulator [Paenibacillus silviterrae]|uniref:helix-turn-helix transcriptional regulator n=1 Tax=Paenibacillus silviterrae TaxID=3242194 RepID=UPI002542C6E0|nr:AraC family transcriptional regulator [Paenibacillus chinjuensis]
MQDYGMEYAELLFYSPTEQERLRGLWPLRAGRNLAKPTYRVGPRVMETYSLHFVMDGAVRLLYEEQQIELEEGDFFCVFPGIKYEYMQPSDSRQPLKMCWLTVDGELVPELLQETGLSEEKPYARRMMTRELERELVGALAAFTQANEPGGYARLMSALYGVFSALQAGKGREAAGRKDDWLERSIRFMEAHFCERITVEDAASEAGIHRSYFSTKFTEKLGIAPAKYLQKLRMEKAASLLLDSEWPVTEIAQAVGYPEIYSFTRFFTHYYGLPPSRYRKEGGNAP